MTRPRRDRLRYACVHERHDRRTQSNQASFDCGNLFDALTSQIPEEGIGLVNRGKELEPMRLQCQQSLLVVEPYVGFYDRLNG